MLKSSAKWWLALNYAATIFLSAFLLFQIQPLVSKYILPWFGGSPAVWTTCMLFFQSLLFAGYAYAHFTQHWLRPKQQAWLHLAVILTALVLLQVVPDVSWKPRPDDDPVGRILLLLAATVGLPYFVLSTTGPLVQAWFARSFPGRTPYRLYALSNLGSLLALLSYPLLFERRLDVHEQSSFWAWGFWAFAVLCGIAAVNLWMTYRGESGRWAVGSGQEAAASEPAASATGGATTASQPPIVAPRWWQRVLWLLLPAFASITLLATTNHVCTDVAVMPFLWVIPLSLYLLTFIVAFDHPRWYRPTLIAAVTAVAIYCVAVGMGESDLYDCGLFGQCLKAACCTWASWRGVPPEQYPPSPTIDVGLIAFLAMNFVAMFGVCLLCHGELVRQRPHPKYLTAFYLMISAGGALGGVAVSLVAPHVFNTFYEWELSMHFGYVLAAGMLLWGIGKTIAVRSAAGQSGTQAASGSPLTPNPSPAGGEGNRQSRREVFARGWSRTLPVLLPLAVVAVIGWIDLQDYLGYTSTNVLARSRNFFGTLMVRERDVGTAEHDRVLKHGTTDHGLQFVAANRRREPTTYYTRFGGAGRTIDYFHGVDQVPKLTTDLDLQVNASAKAVPNDNKTNLKIAAVGLGTGTLAAYVGAGDAIRFYEINPDVIEIADGSELFTFLPDCRTRGGQCEVKLGDARLVLEHELQAADRQPFDLLVLDAFSGDAIPAHLLTEEAFEIYLQHLANSKTGGRDGAIAIHITNHYVDLEPVVRALAERFGFRTARIDTPRIAGHAIYRSHWMVLTKNDGLIDALAPFATPPAANPKPAILWTDDRSNLFDVLK